MISYAPLWRTMKEQGATTYTLRNEGNEHYIGSATVRRLKYNQSVSTNTLDTLCKILKCDLSAVVEYLPD